MPNELLSDMYRDLAGKLSQYARLAVGRILGTVTHSNGAYKVIRSLEEGRLLIRAEVTAMTALLIKKGVFTEAEWTHQMTDEMAHLLSLMKKDWPEVEVDENSFTVKDLPTFTERSRREGWPP